MNSENNGVASTRQHTVTVFVKCNFGTVKHTLVSMLTEEEREDGDQEH